MDRALLLWASAVVVSCGAVHGNPSASYLPPSSSGEVAQRRETVSIGCGKEAGRSGPRVHNLLLRSARGGNGHSSPTFPSGTSSVIASFDLRGVDAHRRVSVHWTTAGQELGRNDFRTTDGTWSLTADLASDAPLPAGEYVVEVRWRRTASGGEVIAATSFAPEGSGELSASFVHTPTIPPGDYRAEVVLDGRELARAPFNVSP